MSGPLLELRGLSKRFPVREGIFLRARAFNQAVDDVSLRIGSGETLGLVGESGCGKSTLARCIVKLYRADAGEILFQGKNILSLDPAQTRVYRQSVQMIFQDPLESLNSRHSVEEILSEPFAIHRIGDRASRRQSILKLLDHVGLPASALHHYPFEFSGGQRQRIGIARALALKPKLIVCDEAVSALDVSIQSQIINLLLDLQQEFRLSYLFIAHDLAVVKHVSDRVAVMYLGQVVETANADEIYRSPKHPYTRSLIESIPVPDPYHRRQRLILSGEVPSAIDPPSGCRFHPRCPQAFARCAEQAPLMYVDGEQQAACHLLDPAQNA